MFLRNHRGVFKPKDEDTLIDTVRVSSMLVPGQCESHQGDLGNINKPAHLVHTSKERLDIGTEGNNQCGMWACEGVDGFQWRANYTYLPLPPGDGMRCALSSGICVKPLNEFKELWHAGEHNSKNSRPEINNYAI